MTTLIIIGVFLFLIGLVVTKAYRSARHGQTLEDWNRQCEEDFKKYGPPPKD